MSLDRDIYFKRKEPESERIIIEDLSPGRGKGLETELLKRPADRFLTGDKHKTSYNSDLGEFSPRKENDGKENNYGEIQGKKLDFENVGLSKDKEKDKSREDLNLDDFDLKLVKSGSQKEFSFQGDKSEKEEADIQPYLGKNDATTPLLDLGNNSNDDKIKIEYYEGINSNEKKETPQKKKEYKPPNYGTLESEPIVYSRRIHSQSPSPSKNSKKSTSPLRKIYEEIKITTSIPPPKPKKKSYKTPNKKGK